MQLHLLRDTFGPKSTLGLLYVDDVAECDTLEDQVRTGPKVLHETAIPVGTYRLIIDRSTRFKRLMPHVLDVPGFEGIRIHSGNTDADTEGCILLGNRTENVDFISESRKAFDAFFVKLTAAVDRGEEVWITIMEKRES
jgi:hypothetical protein